MQMDDSFAAVDFASDPDGEEFGGDVGEGGGGAGKALGGVVLILVLGAILGRGALRPMAAKFLIKAPHSYYADEQILTFTPCKAGDKDLGKIAAYYPEAKELVLSHCGKLGAPAFKGVSGLKKLETLRLDGAKGLAPAGLALLGKNRALKDLSLRGAKIGDESVKALLRSSGLERIDVSGTRISEQGVWALAGLPKLKTLVLDPAFAKAKVLAEIKKQRPKLALSLPGR